MGLKKFNAKKEIKKLKRRNSKLKKIGIIGILIGTIFIISSYALYSYTGSSVAFNSTISKKIQVTINIENGKIEGSTSKTVETDYNQTITEIVTPNEEYEYDTTTCTDNNIKTTYTGNKLTISNAKQNATCTINFDCKLKTGETKTILGKDYDVLASCNQDFSKGFPNANTSEEESERLSGLYKTEDDEGESYYFRGAVENNYVQFGKGKTRNNQEEHELIWRIVRINGDGTIRLLLNESVGLAQFNTINDEAKYTGYTYDNKLLCTQEHPCEVSYNSGEFSNEKFGGINSDIKTALETWYTNNLKNYDDKIATSYFCNDTTYTSLNFGNAIRYYTMKYSLKCPIVDINYGGIYKTKIGLINGDEVALGGLVFRDRLLANNNNYLYRYRGWWTISPFVFGFGKYRTRIASASMLDSYPVDTNENIEPIINLNANVQLTGEGTSDNPFEVIS